MAAERDEFSTDQKIFVPSSTFSRWNGKQTGSWNMHLGDRKVVTSHDEFAFFKFLPSSLAFPGREMLAWINVKNILGIIQSILTTFLTKMFRK